MPPSLPDRLGWYARRLRAMSPAEVVWRVEDRLRQEAWAHRRFPLPAPLPDGGPPGAGTGRVPAGGRAGDRDADDSRAGVGGNDRRPARPAPSFPAGTDLGALPAEARAALLAAADELLAGRAEILGTVRRDMVAPRWSLDPASGRAYPADRVAFRVHSRSPGDPRDVKQVWEISRHHHLTVLACAWRLTGDDRYAERVAAHLRSWWHAHPVFRGVNWSSGIELGIRLVSWAWVRRLLDGWPGTAALVEGNDEAVRQVYWHQRYLATFRSRGSSANNHVVAEAAGQLVAACAFPWFAESQRWRREAAALLEEELARNTFPSGLDREQAFEYHGLVAELGLVAAVEAEAAGSPLGAGTWRRLCRMVDAAAAVLDRAGGAPRDGDGDDGRALLLDDPAGDRWASLLATGAAIFGPLPWWPATRPDARSLLMAALAGRPVDGGLRPSTRPSHFADAGLTILRSPAGASEELWCRCDGGPHGFLPIAAHAHADALSVEVRHDGVALFADPGTYCYHRHPGWRRYFRSTLGHNTLELDGRDQSEPGGPFLWVRAARSRILEVATEGDETLRWSAEHDGYERLDPPARHRRTVTSWPREQALLIVDRVTSTGPHDLRLAFHLGPDVAAGVDAGGHRATLRWTRPDGTDRSAVLSLPGELDWRAWRGSTDPVLGWYSPGFARKVPSTTLVGTGRAATVELRTELRLDPAGGGRPGR